jgi:outer membrane protein insertion porin family
VKRICYIILTILINYFLTGCLGTRYLEKGEYLLYSQKIKGNEVTSKENLEEFYKQKPNKRIPILNFSPYVYFYQWGLKAYDVNKLEEKKQETREKFDDKIAKYEKEKPKKVEHLGRKKTKKLDKIDKTINEGNFLMRLGEPLAVYDTSLAHATLQQLTTYLNTNGFFNAETNMQLRLEDRLVFVTYQIRENQPHIIDSILYDTDNPKIDSLIAMNSENSFLKIGDRYSQDNLVEERNRIEELLQDNGYYAFSRQYINYQIDTTIGDHQVAINLQIYKPSRNANHKVYTIDSVIFTTDVSSSTTNFKRFYERYNGVTYKYIDDDYSKKILDRRVFVYPDQKYSRENTLETQRQLVNLDNFKFVNLNYDTTGGKFIANIFTSPLKKYQMTNEVGVNVTQGFPGPFYNLSLKIRNLFHGLEILEISGRIGYEGVASVTDASKVYSSTEAGASLNLTFPQFILPLSSKLKSSLGKFNPKTSLVSGFAFTNRPEYKRSNFNSHIDYTWQKGYEKMFNVTAADFSLIRSTIKDSTFQADLDRIKDLGNNFWRTFKPSLVLASSFSFTRNYNRYTSYQNKVAAFLKSYIEFGGSVLNFFDIDFNDTTGLELYKYIKVSGDYRRYVSISDRSQVAFRVNVGIAKSYAPNDILPYEKYFFAGGSNSIRAWRPRRLGPGSYFPADTVSGEGNRVLRYNDNFEQPGELIIESSLELRTKVVGFFHTALFLDAGNVWVISKDPQRPGAAFSFSNFYKEIAVGAGIGARFDFTFLLLRLDAGVKIYNPALPPGQRFITQLDRNKIEGVDKIILNLAIGYPF